ncbi:MAG: hypothetical protein OHK0037_27760 [Elainellaceae cyanobacterium]
MQDLLQTGKSTAAKVRKHVLEAIALLRDIEALASEMDGDTADRMHSIVADLEEYIDDLEDSLSDTADALMEVVEASED